MEATCTVEDIGTIECDSEDSAIEPERNDTSKYSEVDAAYGPIPTCSESPMTTESQPSEASVSLTDVGHFVAAGGMSKLKDAEQIKLLDTHWKPSPSDSLDSQYYSSKQRSLKFQWKWLGQHKWLAYSAHEGYKGGWCLPCLLFLTEAESQHLGVFVKTPFRDYNRSKEQLDSHSETKYHPL